MQQPGKPKNMMIIAIIAIVAVVIVVLAVILLGSLNGSSATNFVVLSVDDSDVNFAYWTLNGGKVSVGVVVKNIGTLAGKGEVKVDVNIGNQFHYTTTEKIPNLLPQEQSTVNVDVTIPVVQAAYMGTLYDVEVTATIV